VKPIEQFSCYLAILLLVSAVNLFDVTLLFNNQKKKEMRERKPSWVHNKQDTEITPFSSIS